MPIPRFLNFDRYDNALGLANALGCSVNTFYHSEKDFRQHKIPKKNLKKNGYRVVWEVESKSLLETLKVFELAYFNFAQDNLRDFPLECTHGFMEKKSILTNATQHLKKSVLLKADIKNFFDSISKEHLERHFIQMNLHQEVSKALAAMLTLNGSLPQGFCTSPLMSNLIFLDLDRQLINLALKYNCEYTRYVDDITFSSNKELPTQAEISHILNKGNFILEPSKFRIKKLGQAFYVTGLSIADSQPRVCRKWKRELRQELYFIEKFGFAEHAGRKNYISVQSCINKIAGKLCFLQSIESEKSLSLTYKFQKRLKYEKQVVGYSSREKINPRNIFMYIDEYTKEEMLFLCLVVVEDPSLIETSLRQVYKKLYQNDYLPQKNKALDKELLHWNSLTQDARRDVVNSISFLPFRAFIAFAKYKDGKYKKEYFTLLTELLKNRFCAFDNEIINISVENNTVFSTPEIQEISNKVYSSFKEKSFRCPLNKPTVKVLPKTGEFNLALPDCLLGALGDYIFAKEGKESEFTSYEARYYQLRSKFRCVQYISQNNYEPPFTNRRPFSKSDFNRLKLFN